MRRIPSLVLVCLALAACAASAQNVTILDQNGQPHEVPLQEFQVQDHGIGEHLHAQNGVFVRDINNQAITDPSPDPNGTGYPLAPPAQPIVDGQDVIVSEAIAWIHAPFLALFRGVPDGSGEMPRSARILHDDMSENDKDPYNLLYADGHAEPMTSEQDEAFLHDSSLWGGN